MHPYVSSFIGNGWKVIPIRENSKVPIVNSWASNDHIDPVELARHEPCNWGVVLGEASRGLVDVDLDDDLAVSLAPSFLPATSFKFGRSSRRRSHWFYRVQVPGKHVKFTQPSGEGVIAEYRANGCQTVVPPSTHSGEQVSFDEDGPPAETERSTLLTALGRLSAATLLARSWREGTRHTLALALSGYLLSLGWSGSQVRSFLIAICSTVEDEEIEDRLECVRTSEARQQKGMSNAGLNPLMETVGREVALKIREFLEGKSPSDRFYDSEPGDGFTGTDSWRAERFANQFAGSLFFLAEQQRWYAWTGSKWALAPNAVVNERSRVFSQALRETLPGTPIRLLGQKAREIQFANSQRGIQATVSLAQGILARSIDDLDADSWTIGCPNGAIDLKLGKYMLPDPDLMITKQSNAEFDPHAKCPHFLKFLDRIFGGDRSLISYIQRVAGYCLTGQTTEQCFFIAHGSGQNGKSTLMNTLAFVLGDYACNAQAATFTVRTGDPGQQTSDLARLKGARFVQTDETRREQKLDEALIKQLTGGERLTARLMRENPFEFTPQFKLMMTTNHKPDLSGSDKALFRRVHLIPFDVTIPDSERDNDLANKLRAEGSGILNWALEGCLAWQRDGLSPPSRVTAATETYRREMDGVQEFLDAQTSVGNDDAISKGGLLSAYYDWCREDGTEAVSKRAFSKELVAKGFREAPGRSKGRRWHGLSLKADAAPGAFVVPLEVNSEI